jgi:cytochrome c biogenesis protein ResB
MRRLTDILVSRRASLALMAFIASASAIGAWVPQRSNLSPASLLEWQERYPGIARIAFALGFDRIFSSWWFLAVLAVFGVALAVATWRMAGAAWRSRTGATLQPRTVVPHANPDDIAARALGAGYGQRVAAGERRVFVRHAAGLWAPTVLHVGMLLALTAGLIALTFGSRAIVDLSVGEVREPGDPYVIVEGGGLAQDPDVGRPMRLDAIDAELSSAGSLTDVAATLSVENDAGQWVPYVARVNEPLRVMGHTIYVQPGDFGDAAFLVITTADGAEYRVRMEFYNALPGEVVYSTADISGFPVLDGRWDPHGVRGSEPLALRLAGDEGTQPVSIAPGQTAQVGDLSVHYAMAGKWARLVVSRAVAIELVFLGFAIIGLGSLMLYAWVPRELVLVETADGVRYAWRAARMGRSYTAERDSILGLTGGEEESV